MQSTARRSRPGDRRPTRPGSPGDLLLRQVAGALRSGWEALTRPAARLLAPMLLATAIAAPTASAQQTTPEQARFVASARGQVYYWIGCDSWKSLAPQNLLWFASAAQAERAGYQPSTARGCADPQRITARSASQAGSCTIRRIVDGDTLICQEGDERIRLLLIDAPEVQQEPYGARARTALERLLPPGSIARLELDVQPRDRYGRTLAYLYTPAGALVNAELARQGYALVAVYPPNVRHVETIRAAVQQARSERRGLWATDAFLCTPAQHRANACP